MRCPDCASSRACSTAPRAAQRPPEGSMKPGSAALAPGISFANKDAGNVRTYCRLEDSGTAKGTTKKPRQREIGACRGRKNCVQEGIYFLANAARFLWFQRERSHPNTTVLAGE